MDTIPLKTSHWRGKIYRALGWKENIILWSLRA